jgi:hypothetical protein
VPLVALDSTSAPESTESPAVNASTELILKDQEKKFIPLVDFAAVKNESLGTEDVGQNVTVEVDKAPQPRSIVFPYVYERKNDPRTRYIPLIPQEDLGIISMKSERER